MKFYCAGRLMNRFDDQDFEYLFGVEIESNKRGWIKKNNWGTGWIYEAEESFRSWCAIAYGFNAVPITDLEYQLLNSDGIVYLSKERTEELKKPLITQLSLIAINS
ncbi:MAG TPA: hypothetical protein VIY47_01425 [Ignavibacteriaceae bacterium]